MVTVNEILDRSDIEKKIKGVLQNFDKECSNITFKKGIYIYGSPGCGKTHFVVKLLESLNYDVIKYDAGDVRNKSLVDTITSNNISNRNVLDLMCGRVKKIAIVMDEIDGMNNGDKGGINALIKLIRQKKTKKQKLEHVTMNPIICIGNYYIDKKIKELMKVCHVFEMKSPTHPQINRLLDHMGYTPLCTHPFHSQILDYIQNDMHKLMFICYLYKTKSGVLNEDTLNTIFQLKSYNEDSKKITASLINAPKNISEHNSVINDTERTIVALLWHENIADVLDKQPKQFSHPFYSIILDNICYADYIDRITFQNQIWLFNEMSSLMKTFHNNRLYHTFVANKTMKNLKEVRANATDIRFTKVLTKYSTEYNNFLFFYNMTQELNMDKKDLIALFQEMRIVIGDDIQDQVVSSKIDAIFKNYDVTKLDIRRMYRFLDKNTKRDKCAIEDEEEWDDDM